MNNRFAPRGLLMALLVGCGDALVDGTYRGRSLLSFDGPLLMPEGSSFVGESICFQDEELCAIDAALDCGMNLENIVDDGQCPPLTACREALAECLSEGTISDLVHESDAILRLSVFWAPNETVGDAEYGGEGVEQQSVSTASLPARYTLTLYRPPPKSALHDAAQGQYAMAVVVAYYDLNADGRFDPQSEPLLGGTPEHAILYSPNGVEDPFLGEWGPGYHVISVAECNPDISDIRYQRAEDLAIPVELSGSAPFSRDLLPQEGCENDADWWDEICTDALYWQCAQGHEDQNQCSFCGFAFYEGDDGPPVEDPIDEEEPDEPLDPDAPPEDLPEDDEPPPDFGP